MCFWSPLSNKEAKEADFHFKKAKKIQTYII